MGSEISSFVIEPLMGIGIVALLILAIVKQNQNETTKAKWSVIGAIILAVLLIVANILVSMYA